MSLFVPQAGDGVDADNPWPGLLPFTEQSSGYFYGRETETTELFRLLKREMLTVLFGQSGLGKTSLLQAGLAPMLRQADFLPVYLRLDQSPSPGSPPLRRQLWNALGRALADEKIESAAPGDGETLWEYFHRQDVDFWNAKLDGNIARDKRNIKRLRAGRWRVVVLWECEIPKATLPRKLARALDEPARNRPLASG